MVTQAQHSSLLQEITHRLIVPGGSGRIEILQPLKMQSVQLPQSTTHRQVGMALLMIGLRWGIPRTGTEIKNTIFTAVGPLCYIYV